MSRFSVFHTLTFTDCDDCKCRQHAWDQCALDALQRFRKTVLSWSTCMRRLCYTVCGVWDVCCVSLMFEKFVLCFWDVFLRCLRKAEIGIQYQSLQQLYPQKFTLHYQDPRGFAKTTFFGQPKCLQGYAQCRFLILERGPFVAGWNCRFLIL